MHDNKRIVIENETIKVYRLTPAPIWGTLLQAQDEAPDRPVVDRGQNTGKNTWGREAGALNRMLREALSLFDQ